MHVSCITTLESIMEHKTRQDKVFLSHPNIMWDWNVLTQEAFAFAGLAGFTKKGLWYQQFDYGASGGLLRVYVSCGKILLFQLWNYSAITRTVYRKYIEM